MKRLFKIVGIIVAILIVLVVGLGIFARVIITPQRIKAAVVPVAEKALHRKVALGDINIGLTGIKLKNLTIDEQDGKTPFVSADDLVLRYKLWPLLKKKIVISEVRLDHPVIHVIRKADGQFNFSDLIAAKSGSNGGKSTAAPSAPQAAGKSGASVNLLVSDVSIAGGEIVFEDYAAPFSRPFQYTLTNLSLNASDISLTRSFPFKIDARLKDTPVAISGSINPATLDASGKMRLDPLDVTAFLPYYRDRIPGRLDSAKIRADFSFTGNKKEVASSGTLAIDDVNLRLNALPDAPLRDAKFSVDYDIRADLSSAKLEVRKLAADVNGISINAKGMVNHYTKDPSVDIAVSIPSQSLADVVKAVPSGAVPALSEMKPAGRIGGDIYLVGPVSRPKTLARSADISIENVSLNAAGLRPDITGKVNLRGDLLKVKGMSVALGKDKATVDLTVNDLMAKPLVISNRITSDRLDIDALLAAIQKGGKGAGAGKAAHPAGKKAPSGAGTEIGPIHLPLTVDGSLAVGQAIYHGLTVNHFDAAYRLENNILTIHKMTGEVAGGKFSNSGRLDLAQKGLSYSGKVSLAGVKTNPVISAFSSAASNTVFGNLNLTADFSGRGTQFAAIKKNLSGKADVGMTDAELKGTGLAKGLSNYLNLSNLNDLKFSKMKGNVAVSDGKVDVSSDFEGSRVRMYPKGTVNLDGALDLLLDLRLAPELTSGINQKDLVMQLISDNQGWSRLPLKLTGSWSHPKLVVDHSLIRSSVEQKAKSLIKNRITNEIIKNITPGGKSSPDQKNQENPAEKAIQNTLDKIFGK